LRRATFNPKVHVKPVVSPQLPIHFTSGPDDCQLWKLRISSWTPLDLRTGNDNVRIEDRQTVRERLGEDVRDRRIAGGDFCLQQCLGAIP